MNSTLATDGTVKYFCIIGGDQTLTTTIANGNQLVSEPGEFSDLYVELSGVAGAATSYTFTLMVDSVAQSLSAVVGGATDVSGRDMTNTVRVIAGQAICLKVQSAGVPTARTVIGYVLYFKPDKQKHTILIGGGGGYQVSQTDADQWNTVSGWDAWSTTGERREIVPCKGTFKNLYVSGDVGPGGVTTNTFALQVNGVDTALSVTLVGAATTANDITNSVKVVPGDTVRLVGNRTGIPVRILLIWGLTFVPENDGESILMANVNTAGAANATRYGCLTSFSENTSTWRIRGLPLFKNCYIKNFFVDWGVATGAGQSVDLYISRELQTGATTEEVTTLHVTLSNAQTGNDTLHRVYMYWDFSFAEAKYVSSVTATVPNGTTQRMLWSVVIEQPKSDHNLGLKRRKPNIRVKQRRVR